MAEPISIQQLKDASEDAITLADFIYKPANVMIPRRLAADINSLQYYLDYMSSYAQHSYETYDEMVANAPNLPNGVSAFVTNDLDTTKNGIYTYNGNSFVKGEYQPENAAKEYVEAKLGGLEVFDGKVRSQDVSVEPINLNSGARTQIDKNRENITIEDFFTETEYSNYKANPSTFDATRAIQEFFDYIAINNVGSADAKGSFNISNGIKVGTSEGAMATKHVNGALILTAMNPIHTMIAFEVGLNFVWSGRLEVIGSGGTAFSGRGCEIGIRLGSTSGGYASNCMFGYLSAKYFKQWGVYLGNYTPLTDINFIKIMYCGSGFTYGSYDYSKKTKILNRTDTGQSAGSNQRSVLNLADNYPDNIDTPAYIRHGTNWHAVTSVSADLRSIEVFPWLDLTSTDVDITLVFGGGVLVTGSDSSVLTLGTVDVTSSSLAVQDSSLYGCNIKSLVAQFCGGGIAYGSGHNSGHIGGSIGAIYLEGVDAHILKVSNSDDMSKSISTAYGFDYNKIKYINAPRTSGNSLYIPVGLPSFNIIGNMFEKVSYLAERSSYNVGISSPNRNVDSIMVRNATATANITLAAPDINLNLAYGYNHKSVIIVAENPNQQFSGDVLVTPPVGYTVNGGDSVTLTGFKGSAHIIFYADFRSNNLGAVAVNSVEPSKDIKKTLQHTLPQILAGGVYSTTTTIQGAMVGMICSVSYSKDLQGTMLWGEVVSADTVKIYHRNPTNQTVSEIIGSVNIVVRGD